MSTGPASPKPDTAATAVPDTPMRTQTFALRENEIRIVCFLLEKVHDEFDDELLSFCEAYTEKHQQLREGLRKLQKQEAEAEFFRLPFAAKIRMIFDRPWDTTIGTIVFVITTLFILLSIISLIFSSVPRFNPRIHPEMGPVWLWIEGSVTIYFTIEFILRAVTAENTIDFFKRPTTIADFVAMLPFYIALLAQTDVGALQVFRMVRVFLFFRRFKSVDALFVAVWESLKVLGAPLVFLGTCLIVVSTILYYSERGTYDDTTKSFTIRDCGCESSPAHLFGDRECPRQESLFFSIPHTLWWGVVTMTTVGYGDLVPTCSYGKLVAAVSMVLGVIFMAMPIAIVGNYFTLSVQRREALKLSALQEKCRQREREATVEQERRMRGTEPSTKFLTFLREHLDSSVFSVTSPTPYLRMLLDFYFGTLNLDVNSAPAAVTYELQQVSLKHTSTTGLNRISLNRPLDLTMGSVARGTDLPEPDIILPTRPDKEGHETSHATRGSGVSLVPDGVLRISPKHCILTLPPQFVDAVPRIRPVRGATIFVNGQVVPSAGMPLRHGDTLNVGTVQHPLLFRLMAVHPFALDI